MEVRRFRARIVRQDGECGSKARTRAGHPGKLSADLRVGQRHMIEPPAARGWLSPMAFFSFARQPNTQNKAVDNYRNENNVLATSN
jgi:hypothetical protein